MNDLQQLETRIRRVGSAIFAVLAFFSILTIFGGLPSVVALIALFCIAFGVIIGIAVSVL